MFPKVNAHAQDPAPALPTWGWAEGLLIAGLVLVKLATHMINNPAYGIFRDELYYLACARHLAWGYVDMAPLAAVYARVALALGGSLFDLRVIPALAGAGLVALTMLMTRELGGRRFAMGMAGLAVLAAPIYLAVDSFLSMNAFEPLYWMGCAYVLMRIVRTGNERLWAVFGLLAGLGLENKHSTLLFGFAVAVALVLSPQRRMLRNPWLWTGGGIALLLFLPNLFWQAAHHFPTLEDLRNVQATGKNVVLSPLGYLGHQALLMQPILLPLWLAGLWHFLAGRGTRLRVLGWTYGVLLVTMIVLKGKDYYLAPIYPMLFAGGAVALQNGLAAISKAWARTALRVAIPAVVLIGSVPVAISILPVLPPQAWPAFAQRFHIPNPRSEKSHTAVLPQLLADRTGWEQLTQEVAGVYNKLTPAEQARTAIFTGNYGGAGAIDWYGTRYGLPAAISGHQNYYYWGPRGFSGDILIVLEANPAALAPYCASVEVAARHDNPWGEPEENGPILLCRGLRISLTDAWPRLKHWN